MIYNRMIEERNRLEQEIHSLDQQLKDMPPGNLFFSHNGKYLKWFQSNGRNQSYIPKSNRLLAEQLAKKKYLTLKREELLQEQKAIDNYLKYHNRKCNPADQLLAPNSDYHELLQSYYKPLSDELTNWMNSPYERNEQYPEQLIQPTISGHLVRSKSEALIDMILFRNKIPFRYECKLQLGATAFYPDFTIRHPLTGQTYYWEHFGMMDVPKYSRKAYTKLQRYSSFGIISGSNLITTYETKDSPLNPELVEKIVEYHFL